MSKFQLFEDAIMITVCFLCSIPVVIFGTMFEFIKNKRKKSDE